MKEKQSKILQHLVPNADRAADKEGEDSEHKQEEKARKPYAGNLSARNVDWPRWSDKT